MIIGIVAGCIAMIAIIVIARLYVVYRAAFFFDDSDKTPYDYHVTPQIAAIKEQFDEAIAELLAEPCTEVETNATDGIALRARYYQYAEGAPLLIFFHGYQGNYARDCAGAFYVYKRMGYNLLLVDQRAHGASGGNATTFGNKEHLDCLCWISYAEEVLGAKDIVLAGVSMGGATVINASTKVPASVKCVVADCPYDTPKNIVTTVISGVLKLNATLLYPLVKWSARMFGRFDLEANSPLSSVTSAIVPILLIHGDADDFVPASMSIAIHNAAPQKSSLHLIKDAGHTLSRMIAPAEYAKVVSDFVHAHVKESAQ